MDTRPFLITENRIPKATIVLDDNTSLTASFAADELAGYLTKITGAAFPVKNAVDPSETQRIILGKRATAGKYNVPLPTAGPETDSYTIQTKDSNLFLLGNNDRGLLYSVYALLEHLGVRWFEPGAAGEEIPDRPKLVIDAMNVSERPAFDIRGINVTACGSVCPQLGLTLGELTEQQLIDLIDWLAKQKQNYVSFMSSRIEIESRGWMPSVSREMKKRSLMLNIGGHSWVNAPYGLGDNWYEEPENMDYIAEIDGRRQMPTGLTQEMTAHARTQLCVSSKEGVKKVIDNTIAYLEKNPQIDVLSLFGADNINHWCECKRCLPHSPTDLYLDFIFELGKELKKRCPGKMLQFAAYLDTMVPPEKTDFSLCPDNLMLLFCRFSHCDHAFDSLECTDGDAVNFCFPRNEITMPAKHRNVWYNASLKKWLEHYRGPVCMLDYSHFLLLNSARRGDLLFPSPETLKTDLLYYRKIGVAGHISVIHSRFSWPNAFDMHLLARLNWDPEIDLAKTASEYNSDFYRDAGQRIGEILSELRNLLDHETANAEDVDAIEKYLNEVKDIHANSNSREVKERIDRLCLYLQYILFRRQFNYLKKSDMHKQQATACLRKLFTFCCENQTRIQPYYEILDLLVKKNFEF